MPCYNTPDDRNGHRVSPGRSLLHSEEDLKTGKFNARSHACVGPGGWRCTCCGPAPSQRRSVARQLKKKLYRILDREIRLRPKSPVDNRNRRAYNSGMKYSKTLLVAFVVLFLLYMTACGSTIPGGRFRPAFDMTHGILVDDWYEPLYPAGHVPSPLYGWDRFDHMCKYKDGVIIAVGRQGWCP